ncbi:hydrolase [Synechococcus sp. KORDI-100]|uniref:amidohydrolase n=1 Tax=Synechococcus sp. KORDI-100 TaxID=1280380 RepID=UPI0004E09823|nr:amidohydrolase [Synechococcus sp. KORDI-100]AII42143.1 hydrolase [Synechococcus sp. KORDI-100]
MSHQELLDRELPQLIELRRHLHAHPELSGQEHQTAALVAGELRALGWQVQEGVGRTGVLAEMGPSSAPLVGLRVDMDALPVEERTGLPFASKQQGVMHACGHDIHTCIGLGVARLLAAESALQARFRLLFQPAEELAQGAVWMRDAGATQGLQALFGVHVVPDLPAGTVGVRSGCLTAAAGELEIMVQGVGGHGARPHQAVDAIWLSARVVTELQQCIARRLNALQPVVISFGKIEGGKAFNVIADRVRLLGTVRCLDLEQHRQLPRWIEQTVDEICRSGGGEAQVRYRCIAPPVWNDAALTSLLETAAVGCLGRERVLPVELPSLGAEDFAELLRDVPGTMMRLGVAGPQGCAPLHNGTFDPDERALGVGVQVLTATLLAWMKQEVNG